MKLIRRKHTPEELKPEISINFYRSIAYLLEIRAEVVIYKIGFENS